MIPGRARCGMDIVTIAAAGSFVRGRRRALRLTVHGGRCGLSADKATRRAGTAGAMPSRGGREKSTSGPLISASDPKMIVVEQHAIA
jgi:hypothetical protein